MQNEASGLWIVFEGKPSIATRVEALGAPKAHEYERPRVKKPTRLIETSPDLVG